MYVNLQEDIAKIHSLGLLDGLLEDKTTKFHILWATDAYRDLGPAYGRDRQMRAADMMGSGAPLLLNRAQKKQEQQSMRTRQHAEVFTPLWVCNKMNNYIDEEWFGRPDVFNVDGAPTSKVEFSDGESWKRYIDSRRLEITCGEAPYLVSRYDVSTGESILIEDRIGILDRKLRVVNENASTQEEWMKWALRSFEATYGYEFQGDNVLIARVNLLMTFEEYLEARWHRAPERYEYKKVLNIIVWNIWQMDGLTGTIPYCKAEEEYRQMNLFDYFGFGESEEKNEQPLCRIYDWRANHSLEYLSMGERSKGNEI